MKFTGASVILLAYFASCCAAQVTQTIAANAPQATGAKSVSSGVVPGKNVGWAGRFTLLNWGGIKADKQKAQLEAKAKADEEAKAKQDAKLRIQNVVANFQKDFQRLKNDIYEAVGIMDKYGYYYQAFPSRLVKPLKEFPVPMKEYLNDQRKIKVIWRRLEPVLMRDSIESLWSEKLVKPLEEVSATCPRWKEWTDLQAEANRANKTGKEEVDDLEQFETMVRLGRLLHKGKFLRDLQGKQYDDVIIGQMEGARARGKQESNADWVKWADERLAAGADQKETDQNSRESESIRLYNGGLLEHFVDLLIAAVKMEYKAPSNVQPRKAIWDSKLNPYEDNVITNFGPKKPVPRDTPVPDKDERVKKLESYISNRERESSQKESKFPLKELELAGKNPRTSYHSEDTIISEMLNLALGRSQQQLTQNQAAAVGNKAQTKNRMQQNRNRLVKHIETTSGEGRYLMKK